MEKIYSECPACSGTGTEQVSSVVEGETVSNPLTCRMCGGNGLNSTLSLNSELISFLEDLADKVNDVMDKCNDIFEKVNE